ncbi:hypothetical protein BLA29_014463 [Euroglyphus maynei]|uniref:Cytochrome P450-like protein n=1 Tax=Euroglyphus maynei TaxID=6958 RepID=A0A1Y3B4K6_EURMA|nr:hypothetical protein BLA29_014463 [Euroglyphus maynei]
MEINSYYFLGQIALVTVISVPIFFYLYSLYVYGHWKRHGIRGPKPTPFIGNIFSLSKPQQVLQLEYQKEYGDIYGFR